MVKGKTKSGIKFQIDERVKEDARFLYYMSKIQNKNSDDVVEKNNAIMDLMKLIFGSDEGIIQFMNAVASTNDGICDVKTMVSELTDMFEAMNAKNSSSSRKSSTSARTS